MRVEVEPVGRVDLAATQLGESSAAIRTRVLRAREIAADRFSDFTWRLNADIPARELRTRFAPHRKAIAFLHDELEAQHISARGLHKIIRLAWTLADLGGANLPGIDEVEQAYLLRAES